MDADEESELLAIFLTIMDEGGPLPPGTGERVLNAIREACVNLPYDESTTRPRWIITVMSRTLDLLEE